MIAIGRQLHQAGDGIVHGAFGVVEFDHHPQ